MSFGSMEIQTQRLFVVNILNEKMAGSFFQRWKNTQSKNSTQSLTKWSNGTEHPDYAGSNISHSIKTDRGYIKISILYIIFR